jgi:hypothetical protein
MPLLLLGVKPVQPPQVGVGVIVYPVIAEPLLAGAVQLKLTCPDVPVAVAEGVPGVPGNVPGVAELDADEDKPGPAAFVALTVNV